MSNHAYRSGNKMFVIEKSTEPQRHPGINDTSKNIIWEDESNLIAKMKTYVDRIIVFVPVGDSGCIEVSFTKDQILTLAANIQLAEKEPAEPEFWD